MLKLSSEGFGRVIRQDEPIEELTISSWARLTEAVEAGDKETALELIDYMQNEGRGMHDLYCDWTYSDLDYIARKYGEEEVYNVLRYAKTVLDRAFYGRKPKLTVEEKVIFFGETMRAHRTGPKEMGDFILREEKDRYVTWKEAQRIAGLRDAEVGEIQNLLLEVDNMITKIAMGANLENEDGKIELAFDSNRQLMVADVIGTLDECRFTYDGLQVSKEIAREFYRKTDWYKDVERAKQKAEAAGIKNWRNMCKSNPPRLDSELKTIISEMYMAASNELTGREMFNVSRLANVIQKYRDF